MSAMYFGRYSTGEDWRFEVVVIDDETNERFDLTGASIEAAVRLAGSSEPDLTASTTAGTITVPETGKIVIAWLKASVASIATAPTTATLSIRVTKDGETDQLVIGDFEIYDGVFTP